MVDGFTNFHVTANTLKMKDVNAFSWGGGRGWFVCEPFDNQVNNLEMWLSKDGCNLNTPEGYLRVLSNIRLLSIKPKIVVVDTLHRFLLGDENRAQDTKTMLDACSALMNEFDCSVLLVHHTGVNDEAQHRARGSSAWRGALDIEISVVPSTITKPIEIIQRKSKDAEITDTIYCKLISVPINNWYDEDGAQVTSAIIIKAEKGEQKDKKDASLINNMSLFQEVWIATGMDIIDSLPNISRSSMHDYFDKIDKFSSKQSLKNALSPSYKNGLISILSENNVIECNQINHKITSFSVIENDFISQLCLIKSSTKCR